MTNIQLSISLLSRIGSAACDEPQNGETFVAVCSAFLSHFPVYLSVLISSRSRYDVQGWSCAHMPGLPQPDCGYRASEGARRWSPVVHAWLSPTYLSTGYAVGNSKIAVPTLSHRGAHRENQVCSR